MRSAAATLAALALTATPTVAGATEAPPLPTVEDVPVLAQTWVGNVNDDRLAVLSVHGLRRIDGGTVLYYSMGTPQDALGDRATFSAYGNGNTYVFPQGTNTLCAAAAVDAEQGLAYGALAASTPTGCLSTGIVDFATTAEDPERAPVAHVVLAEVPDDVDVVDVFVASQLVQGVPVEDGPLEPTVEEAAPAVGTGWPSVDAAEVAEADDSRSVFDLQSRVKDLSEDVTTTQDGEQQELDLDASVLFATDEARLTSRARSVIADAAEQIEAAGTSGTITVTGHTDSNASDSYNLDLSQRRARAVGRALEQRLPDGITVRTEGKGEAEPIADNGTAEGRALNRRVTITLPS